MRKARIQNKMHASGFTFTPVRQVSEWVSINTQTHTHTKKTCTSALSLFQNLFTPVERLCNVSFGGHYAKPSRPLSFAFILHPRFEYDFHSNGILLFFPLPHTLSLPLLPSATLSFSHPLILSSVCATERNKQMNSHQSNALGEQKDAGVHVCL